MANTTRVGGYLPESIPDVEFPDHFFKRTWGTRRGTYGHIGRGKLGRCRLAVLDEQSKCNHAEEKAKNK